MLHIKFKRVNSADALELIKLEILFIKPTLYSNSFQIQCLMQALGMNVREFFVILSLHVLCKLVSKLCEFNFW